MAENHSGGMNTPTACARATRTAWKQETLRRVEPMLDTTPQVMIEAHVESDALWVRMGARRVRTQGTTSWWSDHRIGIALALTEHMGPEERRFWSGERNNDDGEGEMCAPRVFEVQASTSWIGPWTLKKRLAKGYAMISTPETRPMLRRAGWRWHDETGLWTTGNPRVAAGAAAYASAAVRRTLVEHGVAEELHSALRHAPALLPWGDEWVLTGKTGTRRGAGRPGAHWHQAGTNAWATGSFTEARAMACYAPTRLADWLVTRNEGTPEAFRTRAK